MPSLIVPSRRSYSSVQDEDGDQESGPSGSATPEPDATGKRVRLSSDRSRRTTTDSWRLETPQTITRPSQRQRESTSRPTRDSGIALHNGISPSPLQEHQPGSIVRVSLVNFVTYSAATFNPGPALNMVIGPNGTGKSTLVCAICLGLGWGTQHLGRAKDVHEFVKHGCEEATIEIELKGRPGRTNPVIKRQINKDNNSRWWIDDRSSNQKHVKALASNFNIQVDNLCQFLPQDRVAEFAAMSDVDRLTQTVRATAPEQVTKWHEDLKNLRAAQKTSEKEKLSAKESLVNLENRQNMQRADVERIREREKIQDDIILLEHLRPHSEYNVAVAKFRELKAQSDTAKDDLKRLEDEVGPAFEAVNKKEEYLRAVQAVENTRKSLYEKVEKEAAKFSEAKQDLEKKFEQNEETKRIKKDEITKKKKLAAVLHNTIRDIESQMKIEPVRFDAADFNERSREFSRQIREIETRETGLEEREAVLTEKIGQKEKLRADAEKEISDLRSQAGQQMKVLRDKFPNSHKAWVWVQQHQDQFSSKIYGPPIVECTVKDERFANAIESLFQRNELSAITTTNNEDMKKLSDQFSKMNFTGISLRSQNAPLSNYRPPVDRQEMKRLGISGWAIDYLSGPETVLSMLCGEQRLHLTAVIENDISEEQFDMLEKSGIDSWVTRNKYYRIMRRKEYGEKSTRITQLRQASIWTQQQVDLGAESNLRDNIEGWKTELQELKQQVNEISPKLGELAKEREDLKAQKKELDDEKSKLQKAVAEFNTLPVKLQTAQEKLAHEQGEEAKHLQELEEINAEAARIVLEKGQRIIDYSKLLEKIREMHAQLVAACIARIEATSDWEFLKSRNAEVSNMLERRRKEVETLRNATTEARQKGRELQRKIEKFRDENPEWNARIEDLTDEERNRTPEEVDLAVESLKARLELIHGGNAGLIKEFEDRARRIDKVKNDVEDIDKDLSTLSDEIVKIRSQWEPELDALFAQISDAFSESFNKINCTGEVSLHKDGENGADFDSWAALIKVKFREEEDLTPLNSFRQSGGERAVSTIFYLMALQSLSRAPFRVVDEINQGMDPRNERMVHERMVDIACGDVSVHPRRSRISSDNHEQDDEDEGDAEEINYPQGSQYFLITPKLLTNLKYVPGMKVHCIASGEYMPNETSQFDFGALVRQARRTSLMASSGTEVH